MPVILRYKGCTFFFFSNEGNPREPLHVHVRRAEATAKLWVEPQVGVAESYGLSSQELNELAKVVADNRQLIERAWHEFFG
jgi:ribosomal protein L10